MENLRRNLTAVLEQDYPNFEVIIINDGNADESEDYLTQLEEKYPNLYHSFVPSSSRYISHKKLAITLGVRASKHDWLVFTEANCLPDSNQWLRTLAHNFTPHTQIVLGYSGYERGRGWLHKRVSFDNLFHAMRYLGYALAGRPYIGIGRNMAYRKELFYAQKGFSAHLDLQRGDDDLFINKAATPENTRVETDADAIVRVQPVYRAKDWREEKVNYAMTAHFYKGPQRYLSGMETGTRLLFLCCLDRGCGSRNHASALADGVPWLPRFRPAVCRSGLRHQPDSRRPEREETLLLHPSGIRLPATVTVPTLENVLSVEEEK